MQHTWRVHCRNSPMEHPRSSSQSRTLHLPRSAFPVPSQPQILCDSPEKWNNYRFCVKIVVFIRMIICQCCPQEWREDPHYWIHLTGRRWLANSHNNNDSVVKIKTFECEWSVRSVEKWSTRCTCQGDRRRFVYHLLTHSRHKTQQFLRIKNLILKRRCCSHLWLTVEFHNFSASMLRRESHIFICFKMKTNDHLCLHQ